MGYRLFVSAGEASGDRHAAALIRAIRSRGIQIDVRGLGGDGLRAEGAELLARVEDLSVLGFAEVARRLPFFVRLMQRVGREIAEWRPHLVVPVDYPGFNLRLARKAKDLGVPVVYYVAPQVWAWRRDRRPGIRRAVDRLLVVFPFEEPLFRGAGIPTTFVGHPLLDEGKPTEPSEVRNGLDLPATGPLLGLLPGSRAQEVNRILPPLIEGTRALRDRGVSLAVSRAPGVPDSLYDTARVYGIPMWEKDIGSLLGAADAALVASGTATLETGLSGTPLAVVYRTGFLNWHLARLLIRLRTVGLVNIAAGGSRIPELLQSACTPSRVRAMAERLLWNQEERREQMAYLGRLRERLGGGGAAERAAAAVAEVLEKTEP